MAIPNTSIFSTSLEEVPVSVTPPIGVNPTLGTVSPQMAFLASPPPIQPGTASWVTAQWQSSSPPYVALCLVGPGGATTLTQGQWFSWIKITYSPEIVVKYTGILQVS